jgi:polyisoprenoid-binding protein YceI
VLLVVVILALNVVTQAEQWQIDPVHSSVNFRVTHLVISKVNGKFNDFSGTVNFDGKDVSNGTVEVTVKTASIDTGVDRRDAHLKSADFFDVEKYPEMTFKSKKVVKGEGQKFQLIGDLTIHGVTKEVTFDCEFFGAADMMGTQKAGFSATTRINRQDYGVSWSKTLDSGGLVASNDVDITIDVELSKVS